MSNQIYNYHTQDQSWTTTGLICNMARHVIARCENFQPKGR